MGEPAVADWKPVLDVLHPHATLIEAQPFTAHGLSCALVDLEASRVRADNVHERYRMTAALCRSPERLPQFLLSPNTGASGFFSLSGPGLPEVVFAEQPEFSAAYQLFGLRTEVIRELFHKPLRDALAALRGLTAEAKEHTVFLMRKQEVLPPEARKAFVEEAGKFFGLLVEGALIAKPVLSRQGDARQDAARQPRRLFERDLRSGLVTRAEVEAFAQSAPPRRVPRAIASQVQGGGLFAAAGVACVVLGAMFAYAFTRQALDAPGTSSHDWATATWGYFFMAMGAPMAYFNGRASRRRRRLLRRGLLARAKIQSVHSTGRIINGRVYATMAASFDAQGFVQEASCEVNGDGNVRAQKLLAAKKAAWILFDPADPTRILFVDSLITESVDYDPD